MSSQEPSAPIPSAPSDPAPSDPVPSSEPPTQESSSAPPNPQPSDPLPNPSSQQPNPEPSNPSNPNPSQPQPSASQPPPTPPPNNPSNPGNPVVISTPSSGVYQSTVVYTSNGSTVTLVTQISTVFPPGSTLGADPNNTGGGGKSNTGAIVGGVVGGVIGLAALVFIFWFLSRRARQKRLEKEFDGDFNPDRIVRHSHTLPPGAGGTLPELGLDEEESRITPFPAPSTPSMTHRPTPSTTTSFSTGNMYSVNPQQHVNDPHPYQGGYPMPVAVNRPPSSVGDHSQSIYSQSTGLTHPSMYQPQQHAAYPVAAAAAYAPSHGSSSLSGGGQIPSRKAQEAGLGRMTVANPNDVVVHQDGGRVPESAPSQSQQQEELPPTYDSIPQDRAGASGSRA